MIRSALNWLLIAVVLACPYQCLAGMVRGGTEQEEQVAQPLAACTCCHHPQPAEQDSNTPPPEPVQHDCFCQGATCDGPRLAASDFAPQAAVLDLLADAADHLSPALLASTAHTPPAEALLPTGWEICVGQCALLL